MTAEGFLSPQSAESWIYVYFFSFLVCFQSLTFKNVNIEPRLSVCVSLASDFSETIEVIIIKLGTVIITASDMLMQHVLVI